MDEYIRDVEILKYQMGRDDGRSEEKVEIVRRMYLVHCKPELISHYAGMDLKTVEKWISEFDQEK